MACSELTICGGTPARLFRISFSGEMAYEIAVPARFGNAMMGVLMEAGKEYDAVPSGTEDLGVMRIEQGHAAGHSPAPALRVGRARHLPAVHRPARLGARRALRGARGVRALPRVHAHLAARAHHQPGAGLLQRPLQARPAFWPEERPT